MLPVLKNLLYVTIRAGYEKRISTELYTSDGDSSTLTWSESSRVQQRYTCAMIGRSWVTRKVVCVHVVAVFQIVHELWVVSHESFTCFTTSAFTLYTYYIERLYRRTLFTPIASDSLQEDTQSSFLLRFKCPYHLSCPCLSTSATLTRLGKRQFGIFGRIWNTITIQFAVKQYNICIYNTIQTIFGQFGMQQPDACTWAGSLNNSTILKPSKFAWRHCGPLNIARKKWKF